MARLWTRNNIVMPSTRRIKMAEGVQVAQRAAADIEAWLRGLPQTQAVVNVEDDPAYRARDIDLLWTTQKRCYEVEIKGDRWHQTGNFFFETHSNREKGTPGCLLYTQADLLFYYFVEPRILYILPMLATRAWFMPRLNQFKERSTTTPVGSGRYYTTVGRLVPIHTLIAAIPDIRRFCLGT
jgi:hypothetical protein